MQSGPPQIKKRLHARSTDHRRRYSIFITSSSRPAVLSCSFVSHLISSHLILSGAPCDLVDPFALPQPAYPIFSLSSSITRAYLLNRQQSYFFCEKKRKKKLTPTTTERTTPPSPRCAAPWRPSRGPAWRRARPPSCRGRRGRRRPSQRSGRPRATRRRAG